MSKWKPDTASKTKTFSPFKQVWGSDVKYFTGIGVIFFEEVEDDDDQSKGNDDNVDLIILGQGPTITSDTGSEPKQVIKACQYQLCNDLPWVTEARNPLLSQDLQALSNVRWDCNAILMTILEEAKLQDILWVEPKVPSEKSLYAMWNLAQE